MTTASTELLAHSIAAAIGSLEAERTAVGYVLDDVRELLLLAARARSTVVWHGEAERRFRERAIELEQVLDRTCDALESVQLAAGRAIGTLGTRG